MITLAPLDPDVHVTLAGERLEKIKHQDTRPLPHLYDLNLAGPAGQPRGRPLEIKRLVKPQPSHLRGLKRRPGAQALSLGRLRPRSAHVRVPRTIFLLVELEQSFLPLEQPK